MRYVQVKRLKLPIVYITATSHMHTALGQVGTVLDTDNLHFSADMPHRFSEGSRATIRWCRVAIRGSPARQCGDRLRICTMQRMSADECRSVRTQLKTGIDCWILAVTLPLRLYPMVSHFVTRILASSHNVRSLFWMFAINNHSIWEVYWMIAVCNCWS